MCILLFKIIITSVILNKYIELREFMFLFEILQMVIYVAFVSDMYSLSVYGFGV